MMMHVVIFPKITIILLNSLPPRLEKITNYLVLKTNQKVFASWVPKIKEIN